MLKKIVIPMVSILVVYGSALYAEEASEQEQAVYGEEAPEPERVKRFSGTSTKVSPGEFPWVVDLEDDNGWWTGFLITRKHVLTVAHNLEKYSDGRCLKVHFNNATSSESGFIKARRFLLHPNYDNREDLAGKNDLAVIELSGPMMAPGIVNHIPDLDTKQYTCKELSPGSHVSQPMTSGYGGGILLKMNLRWGYGAVRHTGDCREDGSVTPELYMLMSRTKFYHNKGRIEGGDEGSPLFFYNEESNNHKVVGMAVAGDNSMFFLITTVRTL